MISPAFLISFGTGLTMIVFGINQFKNPQNWLMFVPSFLTNKSPMKPETSMRLHALGNIVFGLFLIFPLYPLVAAWIGFIWWLSILPFAFKQNWMIGMRDLSITFALLGLIVYLS